jgi:hypothetical protein
MGIQGWERAWVGAIEVGHIRKTDGDYGGCWCDRSEITSDFGEVGCVSRSNYDWQGGGRSFGIDSVANIV